MVTLPPNTRTIDRLERYRAMRPFMNTGDIIEFHSRSIIGAAIRLRTGNWVNHTAMIIRFEEFDRDRVYLLEALENGITINYLSRRLEQFDGAAVWLRLYNHFADRRRRLGKEALKYVGIPYDYGSILRQLVAKVSADAKKLFCSEYVYCAAKDAGLPVNIDYAPQPGDFLNLGIWQPPKRIL